MNDYKEGWNDLPDKGADVPGRVLRRFLTLLAVAIVGLVVIYGAATSTPPTAVVTTAADVPGAIATTKPAPPPPPAVAVDAAPSVNVSVENPPAVDNTVALMAYQSAAAAQNRADAAHELASALYPRVADLEAAAGAVVDPSPTLVAFDSRLTAVSQQLDALTAVFAGALVGLILLATAVAMIHNRTTPTPRLTIEKTAPPERMIERPRVTPAVLKPSSEPRPNPSSEQFRTVPNWLDLIGLPLDGSAEPPPEVRQLWRRLHANGMSKTAICETFYDSKGANYRWVKAAFDEATIIQE